MPVRLVIAERLREHDLLDQRADRIGEQVAPVLASVPSSTSS